jgi:hypothetical protein
LLYAYTDLLRPGERFLKSYDLLGMAVGLDPHDYAIQINLASLLEEQCLIDAQYCAEAIEAWVRVEAVARGEQTILYARERRRLLEERGRHPAPQ